MLRGPDIFPLPPWVEGILFPLTPATVGFHLHPGVQQNLLSFSKGMKALFP